MCDPIHQERDRVALIQEQIRRRRRPIDRPAEVIHVILRELGHRVRRGSNERDVVAALVNSRRVKLDVVSHDAWPRNFLALRKTLLKILRVLVPNDTFFLVPALT